METMSSTKGFSMKIDQGYKRLALWVTVWFGLSLLIYLHQIDMVISKVVGVFFGNIGSLYPLAALFFVGVFLLLRWQELHQILLNEHGFSSKPATRLIGVLLILIPMALTQFAENSIALSATIMVIVWYGTSLAINPSTLKMLLPYAILYTLAVPSPSLIESIIGEPLAGVASFLTRIILYMINIPVSWEGSALTLNSKAGGIINVSIDPGCSSISSITVFLLLCGLMHLDLKKKPSSTLKLASLGTVALTLLNAVRISSLIWTGYVYGNEALWSLHSWIGYAIFTTFYAVAIVAYMRMDVPLKPKLGQVTPPTGKTYSAFDPVLISVIGIVFLTEYLLVYVAGAIGVTFALISILAIYSLIAILRVSEPLAGALEDISLLFLYIMLASALPWFFFRQDLLVPSVYSIVLGLCFWRIYSRNLSFKALGFVRGKTVRDSLLGIFLGIFLGVIEYYILRPAAATPSFSYAYFLQTIVYMFFFVGLGEEVLFRALIQNSVINMVGVWPGIFWSGVIFGVMHTVWRSVPELFFTFAAGIMFGIFYHRTGSLVGPVFLHGTNNVMLLAVLPYLLP